MKSSPNTSPAHLHQLIERLSALFRSSFRQAASRYGLKLVQLEALVLLARANRYSDTPAALTEYLGVTKGTVSQTLKALERRGLIRKQADPDDGRVWHCRLTRAGQQLVDEAYPAELLRVLPSKAVAAATTPIEELLRSLQHANGLRSFGVCESCRFFERQARGGRCGLTQEKLSPADTLKICREHEPRSAVLQL